MRRAVTALTIIGLLVSLSGCALFGTTRKERVLRFEVGLNESREYLYQEFYEAATADYELLESPDLSQTWDLWFPPEVPEPGTYTLSADDYSTDVIQATVTGPDTFGGPKPLELYLVRVGINWYLEKLVLDGDTIVD